MVIHETAIKKKSGISRSGEKIVPCGRICVFKSCYGIVFQAFLLTPRKLLIFFGLLRLRFMKKPSK